MQVIIYRGTHQIGGIAIEIRTHTSRIIFDMGNELGTEDGFVSEPLHIPGVTDNSGICNAVLFTHNHADHIGQLKTVREDIPLYMGSLAKDIYLATMPKDLSYLRERIAQANSFDAGKRIQIGDILVTPFSIDHSACDSYMFLVEADGKKLLYTGDFRLHGFRGKAFPKMAQYRIGRVDTLIIEGTALSRSRQHYLSEADLQRIAKKYVECYKYVFVLCASTNLERICALSKAVPRGKYFICDDYQEMLLELLQQHWGEYSSLYRNIKRTRYGSNLLAEFKKRGFMMMVRDNRRFREIMEQFDKSQSIILYSMWDGYRTRQGSSIPDFLNIIGRWEPLHTSGHISQEDLKTVIDMLNPREVIPIHTDAPDVLREVCKKETVVVLEDGKLHDVG